ncbi:MAG TPA: hypothetical protein VN812_17765, partial [Candidatus Acidoferrales bacterium]|nr:hypothetical protein [Candidatus Acidoferrales bacterium]
RGRFATLCIAGIVAAPFSSLYFYTLAREQPQSTVVGRKDTTVPTVPYAGDRSAGDRVVRNFVTTPGEKSAATRLGQKFETTGAVVDPVNEWLMARRGQGGVVKRYLFGVLLPFTGVEWFGFFFWFFAVALVRWVRQRDKSVLETIMAWSAVAYVGVVLSGVSILSWSNPRYTGTLAPVIAYFTGTFAAGWWQRDGRRQRRRRVVGLLVLFLVPLGVITCVRGAKVGITNPGDFYENLHSTRWLWATVDDPLGSLHTLWDRYFGFRKTVRYAWASDSEKLLNSHDYFRAVDYMNCCTAPDASGLVIGRETYYFYYARRRGVAVVAPDLFAFRVEKDPSAACKLLQRRGIDYVLIDSYYSTNPWFLDTPLAAILRDSELATLVFEAGTAQVHHLTCGRATGGSAASGGPES